MERGDRRARTDEVADRPEWIMISSAERLKTLRRPEATVRWIHATEPSGSQILRHSLVSAIT